MVVVMLMIVLVTVRTAFIGHKEIMPLLSRKRSVKVDLNRTVADTVKEGYTKLSVAHPVDIVIIAALRAAVDIGCRKKRKIIMRLIGDKHPERTEIIGVVLLHEQKIDITIGTVIGTRALRLRAPYPEIGEHHRCHRNSKQRAEAYYLPPAFFILGADDIYERKREHDRHQSKRHRNSYSEAVKRVRCYDVAAVCQRVLSGNALPQRIQNSRKDDHYYIYRRHDRYCYLLSA